MNRPDLRTSTGRVPDANSLDTLRVIHQRALGYKMGRGFNITTRAKMIHIRGQVVEAMFDAPIWLNDSQNA